VNLTLRNLFADLSKGAKREENLFALFENSSVRIERIVSRHYSSPSGFWYDQDGDEWVIVLRGNATLEFESGESVEMSAGDYLDIPRHVKHRVARTGEETIWLAVHSK
jgi:cupin 2 domain-containing protein